ncbi:hypothetical protein [Buchnera aphidicola]|uniref:hypothetical protein n=1 Tax=Buchnera aphidicola TaxID=9 RepID=UPI003464A50E
MKISNNSSKNNKVIDINTQTNNQYNLLKNKLDFNKSILDILKSNQMLYSSKKNFIHYMNKKKKNNVENANIKSKEILKKIENKKIISTATNNTSKFVVKQNITTNYNNIKKKK